MRWTPKREKETCCSKSFSTRVLPIEAENTTFQIELSYESLTYIFENAYVLVLVVIDTIHQEDEDRGFRQKITCAENIPLLSKVHYLTYVLTNLS